MRRCSVVIVVVLAMLWQSVALARAGSTINPLVDGEHAALHWHEEGHRHHDDGSYHQDDSPDSVQHVLDDPVSTTVALLVAALRSFPPQGSAPPGGLHLCTVPDPALEGLLRPPRTRA